MISLMFLIVFDLAAAFLMSANPRYTTVTDRVEFFETFLY